MGIKVYVTSISCSSEVRKRQQLVNFLLDGNRVDHEKIDVAVDENIKKGMWELCTKKPKKGKPQPPQFFKDDEYLGDYEDFEKAKESEKLWQFLKINDPTPKPKKRFRREDSVDEEPVKEEDEELEAKEEDGVETVVDDDGEKEVDDAKANAEGVLKEEKHSEEGHKERKSKDSEEAGIEDTSTLTKDTDGEKTEKAYEIGTEESVNVEEEKKETNTEDDELMALLGGGKDEVEQTEEVDETTDKKSEDRVDEANVNTVAEDDGEKYEKNAEEMKAQDAEVADTDEARTKNDEPESEKVEEEKKEEKTEKDDSMAVPGGEEGESEEVEEQAESNVDTAVEKEGEDEENVERDEQCVEEKEDADTGDTVKTNMNIDDSEQKGKKEDDDA